MLWKNSLAYLLKTIRNFPRKVFQPFLNECLIDPGLWSKIKPALGSAGLWLINMNPNWQELEPEK